MRLLHDFHAISRAAPHHVDEKVILDAPPSIIVSAIERYLDVCKNVLDVAVPIGHRYRPEAIAVETTIAVDRRPCRNRAFVGRFDERLEVFFSLVGMRRPFFAGRFTVRPLGVRTELQLKGCFSPPPGLLEAASLGGAFDPEIVQETIRTFLNDLKPIVETEYRTLKSAYAPWRRIDVPSRLRFDDLLPIC